MTRIQRLPSPTPIITAVKTCTNHYQPRRSPCVGCVTGAVVSGRHSGSPDSELFVSLTRVRWLLFDSHIWHTLFPVCADTHTRTATFRACGYIGVIASAPLSIRNGWKPQYDGAYPRREQARGIAPVPSITQTTGNSSTAFIPSGLLVIIVMSIHTDPLLTLDLI